MFSEYIKITGRGEKGRRPLTQQEANAALTSYLNGDAELLQLAVLLMLQRVRCETPEEAAGYIQALRDKIPSQWSELKVDLDWPCFAGKKRQPPWLLLAAKVLSQQGVRVFLHGHNSIDAIKYQVESACPTLNIPIVNNVAEAESALSTNAICYAPLSAYCPELIPLLALRDQVGLRTPLNTVARSLNPSKATHAIHGVFHKGYEKLHAQAALLTDEVNMIAFKGEGGESEINPRVATKVCGVKRLADTSQYVEEEWPTHLEQVSGAHTEVSAEYLQQVWIGETVDHYGDAAVITTIAVILNQMQLTTTQADSLLLAEKFWLARDKSK